MNNFTMRVKTFIVFILSFAFLFSCSSSTGSEVQFSGTILNSTALGVRSASITLTNESENFSAATDEAGEFIIEKVPNGSYTFSVTATGYTDTSFAVEVDGDAVRSDTLYGTANVSGFITNSQTGTGLDSALVSFSFGTDTSVADIQVTTDINGFYNINQAPTGVFICVVRRSGFFPQVVNDVNFANGDNTLPSSVIVQVPPPGSMRIVLTWGESPSDLDSHLTGPEVGSSNRFHCYFVTRSPVNSNVFLDVDDVTSYGPETTTITQFQDGMYRFSVQNYSDRSSSGSQGIANSPGVVEVYGDSGLLRRYEAPPATSGNTWRVFEIDALNNTPTFRDINEYMMDGFKNLPVKRK